MQASYILPSGLLYLKFTQELAAEIAGVNDDMNLINLIKAAMIQNMSTRSDGQ